MFERLKELICDMAKFLTRLGAGLILSALPISNKESHLCAMRGIRFPCRPHKTRASGRDRRPWLYPRSTACYPCGLTASDTIQLKTSFLHDELHAAKLVLLMPFSLNGRAADL